MVRRGGGAGRAEVGSGVAEGLGGAEEEAGWSEA